ncbi:MAG: glycosyltransferase 87 family protein, partial [Bifidobacteriaceae bacterium]|nr:glycosyltransferase 87 family protein [Bifidobacteriaceae bacterium]
MTASRPVASAPAPRHRSGTVWRAAALAVAFAATHAWMIYLSRGPGLAGSTDVSLYAWWVQQAQVMGGWVGIQADWVYPVGALAPIAAAAAFGTHGDYLPTWCYMVTLLNLATALVAVRVVSLRRAFWPLIGWFAFLALLGPVGFTRLDAVMMPLVLTALLVAGTRPALASVLVTLSAWIKVAGGAVIIPLFCAARTARDRWLRVALPAALTCVAVIGWQRLAGGGWSQLTSFVRAEAERGLQIEAVLAMPAVLGHVFKGEATWQYNDALGTSETWGAAADAALRVSDFAMPAVAVVVGVLVWLARHEPADALLEGSFAIMTGLIVFHKVGSPQFVAWTAPAVVAALCLRRQVWFWTVIGVLLLSASALTGWLYPWGYFEFLDGAPLGIAVWV